MNKTTSIIKKQNEWDGFHILADFYKCSNLEALQKIDPQLIASAIDETKMRVAKFAFHEFVEADNSGSYSAAFVLYESHVTIHTWPLERKVNIDIYVCHFSQDNTSKAIRVYKFLHKLFKPKSVSTEFKKRGNKKLQ